VPVLNKNDDRAHIKARADKSHLSATFEGCGLKMSIKNQPPKGLKNLLLLGLNGGPSVT
jgi:hypothetical protein